MKAFVSVVKYFFRWKTTNKEHSLDYAMADKKCLKAVELCAALRISLKLFDNEIEKDEFSGKFDKKVIFQNNWNFRKIQFLK